MGLKVPWEGIWIFLVSRLEPLEKAGQRMVGFLYTGTTVAVRAAGVHSGASGN